MGTRTQTSDPLALPRAKRLKGETNPLGVRNVPPDTDVYIIDGACWAEPLSKCLWCRTERRHRHLVDETGEVSNAITLL